MCFAIALACVKNSIVKDDNSFSTWIISSGSLCLETVCRYLHISVSSPITHSFSHNAMVRCIDTDRLIRS